ncbi:MAG: hypothetical protein FWH18_03755 [Marinilabiliaceae bacterium]|nr:hypothetical protein [Marinilabiliaceae bacterium]
MTTIETKKMDKNKKQSSIKKPYFHGRIFWDINLDKLDYDKSANFIIERVFERGDVEDIRQCRRYYNEEKVAEALLNAKFLMLKTIYLVSAVVGKPLEDFRCYKQRVSTPEHYPY